MLGYSSKGMNTIEMMSYGLGAPPVRLVGFEFKLGYKERTSGRPQTRELPDKRTEQAYMLCVCGCNGRKNIIFFIL